MKDLFGAGWSWPPSDTIVEKPLSHLFPSFTAPPSPPPQQSLMSSKNARVPRPYSGEGNGFKYSPPCVHVERQMWPILLTSLVMAGSQFIVGLSVHHLATPHCLSWSLTMMASGGLIVILRSFEGEDAERMSATKLKTLTSGVYLMAFVSAAILFAIMGALWLWFAFCAAFSAITICIIEPMYWNNR